MTKQERIQEEIDRIVTDVQARKYSGWKFNRVTNKALNRIEELGLTEYIPGWMTQKGAKSDAIINEIIRQAEHAGGPSKSVADGIDDAYTQSDPASLLWTLLNADEPEPTPEPELTDEQQVETWMRQEAPAIDELIEDDVTAARIADMVLQAYNQRGIWGFELDRAMPPAYDKDEYQANLEMVKRGFAILSGYCLEKTERKDLFIPLSIPDSAVAYEATHAGYIGTAEAHRLWYLIPAGDLVTISEAAEILGGENTQTARVQIARHIRDGHLQLFLDKTENNPQQWKRVSRDSIKRLREFLYAMRNR
jgi:hypothetical protein